MSLFKRKKRQRLWLVFAVAVATAAIAPVARAAELSPTAAQYDVKNHAAMQAYAERWLKRGSTMTEQQARLSPTSAQYLVGNRQALEAYEHRFLPAAKHAASSSVSGLITDNSPSQNRISRAQQFVLPPEAYAFRWNLITENSASQNQIGKAQPSSDPYGPPDPWAYRFEHPSSTSPVTSSVSVGPYIGTASTPSTPSTPFISENSASQNQVALRNAEGSFATPSSSVFDWGDAGVGAGSAAGLMLLLTAAAAFVIRRNQARRIVL